VREEQEDGDARDGGPGEPAGDFEDAAFDEQGAKKRTAPTNDSAMSREVYFVIRVVNAALPGMRSTSEMVWRTFSRSWSPSTVSLRASSFASRSLMSGSVGPCVEASGSWGVGSGVALAGTGAIGAAGSLHRRCGRNRIRPLHAHRGCRLKKYAGDRRSIPANDLNSVEC